MQTRKTLKDILRLFEDEFERVLVPEGTYLIRQNEAADCLYLVVSGRLNVVLESDTEADRVVAQIPKGETVGEMSLITGRKRSTSVVAARDCEVLKIPKERFDALLIQHPELLLEITRTISHRLSSTTRLREVKFKPKMIVILPAGNGGPSITQYISQLRNALSQRGTLAYLDETVIEQSFANMSKRSDSELDQDTNLLEWLNRIEDQHDFVLCVAQESATWWTKRCIRTADRVYLVGVASSAVALNNAERFLFDSLGSKNATSIELLLILPQGATVGHNSARWRQQREVIDVHHVDVSNQNDVQRQVRLLLGEAVGLVLGGGGARGLAHIGVIRAMSELGIPIDMIGGTSIGSVVAALHSVGLNPREQLERIIKYSNLYKPYRQYTLPLVSLLRTPPVENFYKALYGDAQIEDSKTRFFCISCNLNSAQRVVHNSGPFFDAVRASTAIPAAFAPFLKDGALLVDGGIMDNLPIKEMKARGAHKIIAVDVAAKDDLHIDANLKAVPTGWQLLWRRVLRFRNKEQFPHIMEILMRTLMVNSVAKRSESGSVADLILRPPADETGMLDFSQMEKVEKIGYDHAMPILSQHLRLP